MCCQNMGGNEMEKPGLDFKLIFCKVRSYMTACVVCFILSYITTLRVYINIGDLLIFDR